MAATDMYTALDQQRQNNTRSAAGAGASQQEQAGNTRFDFSPADNPVLRKAESQNNANIDPGFNSGWAPMTPQQGGAVPNKPIPTKDEMRARLAPPQTTNNSTPAVAGALIGPQMTASTVAPPQAGTPGAPGSTPTPGAPAPFNNGAAPGEVDPFEAMGGGVKINGNWYEKSHPGAVEWLKTHPQGNAPAAPAPTAAPPPPPPTEPQPPPAAAPTPNAPAVPPPGASTPTESTEQFNTALRSLMGTKEVASVNDENIRAQLDPMRAEAERAMRGEVREGAEAAFAGGQDFGSPEKVAAMERQGNKVGLAAADLVGRETMANREKILNGLKLYGDRMSQEQRNALEEKLATMDINLKKYLGDKDFELGKGDQDIKRQGLADARALGGRELDIKDRLGMGDLNIRSILAQLQNQQFNKRYGLDVGMAEQDANERALRAAMGL